VAISVKNSAINNIPALKSVQNQHLNLERKDFFIIIYLLIHFVIAGLTRNPLLFRGFLLAQE
jgi:hypothetical protein